MLKNWLRRALRASGANGIARRMTRHTPRILMYHRFRNHADDDMHAMSIDALEEQLRYLRQHFQPLKLSELFSASAQAKPFPENAVAITIDDGHESFLEVALPVFRELEIPATIFVCPGLVEKGDWIWADKFNYIVDSRKAHNNVAVPEVTRLWQQLLRLPVLQRDQTLSQFAAASEVSIPATAPARYRLMSWSQLQDLQRTGLIEIGSHSNTHPIMSSLEPEDSRREIKDSAAKLASRLGCEVTSFCFPNGQPGDFLPQHLSLLEETGYRCGIASHFGYVTKTANRFVLPRIAYTGSDFNLFAKYVDGVEYLQRRRAYEIESSGHSTQ